MATSATSHTAHANLSQFADNDKPTWLGDYNADMNKIDGHLSTTATAVNAANQASNEAKASAASAHQAIASEATARSNADTALDSKYAEIVSEVLESIGALDTATDGRLDALETGITDRYTKAESNGRFLLKGPKPRAIFIGSSNSTPGTWTESFCTTQGWTGHNYSVGGGGFVAQGGGSMYAQALAAIADKAYPHEEVEYVFMCDAGNDIRAIQWPVTTEATKTFSALRTEYPKARIIAIPALWGQTDRTESLQNTTPAALRSLTTRIAEIAEAGMPFGVEVVQGTHSWHWDSAGWMLPKQVHYTPAGYARIAQMMNIYMKGGYTWINTKWESVSGSNGNANVTGMMLRRFENEVQCMGEIIISSALPADTDFFTIPLGMYPIQTVANTVSNMEPPRTSVMHLQAWSNGFFRAFSGAAAGTWAVNMRWSPF